MNLLMPYPGGPTVYGIVFKSQYVYYMYAELWMYVCMYMAFVWVTECVCGVYEFAVENRPKGTDVSRVTS